MADKTRYFQTPYTFISPVRYFKANDPYYYEIDNIPIKQLEESQNFLKDQVDGLIKRKDDLNIEIDRSSFSELRPYVTGSDRKVRVKPGKFTARINNAFNLTPLQVIEQIAGFSNTTTDGQVSDLNTWRVETNKGPYLTGVLQQFQEGLNGDALNMNGLAERAFVFPIDDEDGLSIPNGTELLDRTQPGYADLDSDFDPDDRPLYPNYIGAILKHTTSDITRDLTLIRDVYTSGKLPSGSQQGRIESEFIKRWRGAIRTSVVDVAEELVITVPDFDENDYYYTDTNGINQTITSTQRIDLLFIYSKAVDEESTTIPKFDSNGNPTTLVKPALGILKGAGIGFSRQTSTNNTNADDRVSLQTLEGTPIMLGHPGDVSGQNNGFQVSGGVIRGSFPSPDDLLNLAPVLSENLESDSFALIGQSILPIAYVRVGRADAGPLASLIIESDIIDIRPFFRTTELAYNERAGIAAATPQISIANPVVTEAHLEKVRKEVYADLNDKFNSIIIPSGTTTTGTATASTGGSNNRARTIAAGQVLGGFWGPEGALIKHASTNTAGGLRSAPMNQFVDVVEQEFGYPVGSIPYYPDWDKATWYDSGQFNGNDICDHINIGAPMIVEPNGPSNDVKYMPPWINDRTDTTTATVAGIRSDQGDDRFSMYEWGSDTEMRGPYAANPFAVVGADPNPNGISIFQSGNFNTTLFSQSTRSAVNRDHALSLNNRNVQINYVTKRIKLDLANTPWVSDYQVKVNLLHCTPLCDYVSLPSRAGSNNGRGITDNRNSSQVWVQKYKDYFIICVAWAGTNLFAKNTGDLLPWNDRNNPEKFAGFAQPQMNLLGGSTFTSFSPTPFGQSVGLEPESARQGLFTEFVTKPQQTTTNTESNYFNAVVPLLYPSIQWEVIGLSNEFVVNSLGSGGANMRQKDPTVVCR